MFSSRSNRKLTNPTGLPASLAMRKLREKKGEGGRERERERERRNVQANEENRGSYFICGESCGSI